MNTPSEQLLEGAGLRVRFVFCEDRFAHEIWLADGAAWVRVLNSLESPPSEAWPASPALQSVHLETGPQGTPTALLVGMAGKSHYSLSVTLDAATKCAHFDVACRTGGHAIGPLGSHYQAWQTIERPDAVRETLWVGPSSSARLELQTCQPLGPAHLEVNGDEVGFVAAPPRDDQRQTVRWGYTITRRDGPPSG